MHYRFWGLLDSCLAAEETLIFAVDVAKVQQYALFTNQAHTQNWLMQWSHLEHTSYLIEQLKAPDVPIAVVMESTMPIRFRLPQVCLSWHDLTHARLSQDTHGVPAVLPR